MERQHHLTHFCLTHSRILQTQFAPSARQGNASILVAAEGPADSPQMVEGLAAPPVLSVTL
jgi:hypothetical protein